MKQTNNLLKSKFAVLLFLSFLLTAGVNAQFVPGSGGSIPTGFSDVVIPNKIPGFVITKSVRENNYFYSGTRALVEMSFPTPSTIGATTYTLQYSANDGISWSNFKIDGKDLTTNYDNFSLNLDMNYKLRLLVNGGPKDGFTSNEESVTISSIDTYLGGWSIDESMYISGVMWPWVGRGLTAGFTFKKLSDNDVINKGVTYKWYRVHPVSYLATPIVGADSLTYITTDADAGYKLMIKATGDGINVGGYANVFSSSISYISNKSFVNNVTTTGLTLNMYKSVSSLKDSDLVLRDKDYQTVAITAVTQAENAAIYRISAALDPTKAPYQLESACKTWKIASMFMMMDLMPFVNVEFAALTSNTEVSTNKTTVFPSVANSMVNISSSEIISRIEIYTINGILKSNYTYNTNQAQVDVSALSNGLYIVKVTTDKETISRKIEVKR